MDGLLILNDSVFWTIGIFKDMINFLPYFYSQETRIYTNWSSFTQNDLLFPLDCKEIKPVNPKGNQPSMFFGRTDAESEAPILWPPNAKNQLLGKDPDAGKDWRQEDKGTTEVKMIGWHHWLDGHEIEQAPGVGDGQGSLACCSPWGHKKSDMTEQLNNNRWLRMQLGLNYTGSDAKVPHRTQAGKVTEESGKERPVRRRKTKWRPHSKKGCG